MLLHLMCANLDAAKAVSTASLKGTAKGVELNVKPSAPTSVPLRVRFGTGSPTGTVVNPMFAQDGTASRYTSPDPLSTFMSFFFLALSAAYSSSAFLLVTCPRFLSLVYSDLASCLPQ